MSVSVPAVGGVTRFRSRCDGSCVKVGRDHLTGGSLRDPSGAVMLARVGQEGIVGRERELDALRRWLDAARAGAGRVVFCSGEAGIGKSRLGQELAGVAVAVDCAVAWGRCPEVDGAPAFWDGVRFCAVWMWTRCGVRGFGGVACGSLSASRGRERGPRSGGRTQRPVIVLDDIHRGDEPSLVLLRHLADRIADMRLLVFAAFRDGELSGPLSRMLPELLGTAAVERIDLRSFGPEEVRAQLAVLAPGVSERSVAAVVEATGGNPLFVREVARAMADGTWRADRPPRSVLDVVRARLDRVSADCRGVLQAAAVVGREFSLALVAAARRDRWHACSRP